MILKSQYRQSTLAEHSVANAMQQQGCQEVLRGGWPDILIKTPSGKVVLVELKSHRDIIRPNQIDCHRILIDAGLDVRVMFYEDALSHDWSQE